jgi:hypothetical protein
MCAAHKNKLTQRAMFRDAGFASDSVKINVEQIFKLMGSAPKSKRLRFRVILTYAYYS